ncbi:hypothetical protein J6590_065469 [Homalodisca vitripennis]|nr:hypothetical protein J6590_065469 [Homalodisca vitripennis]
MVQVHGGWRELFARSGWQKWAADRINSAAPRRGGARRLLPKDNRAPGARSKIIYLSGEPDESLRFRKTLVNDADVDEHPSFLVESLQRTELGVHQHGSRLRNWILPERR